ncbi:MAG: DUF6496 domain-containing protein [Bryobacteraceae bacterium]
MLTRRAVDLQSTRRPSRACGHSLQVSYNQRAFAKTFGGKHPKPASRTGFDLNFHASRKQAVAIALNEARKAGAKIPKKKASSKKKS